MKTALLQMEQIISSYIKAKSAEIYHHHLPAYFTDSPSFVNCNHLSCLLFCANIFVCVRGELLSLLWVYIGFTVLTTHLVYSLRKICLLRIKTNLVQELCQSFQSLPILKDKYFQESYMWKQWSHGSFLFKEYLLTMHTQYFKVSDRFSHCEVSYYWIISQLS